MNYKLLDIVIEAYFIPYLIIDGNKTIKISKNKLSDYVISNKLKDIKRIVKKIFSELYEIKNYQFDTNTRLIKVNLKLSSKHLKNIYFNKNKELSLKEINKIFKDDLYLYFGNYKKLIGHLAPDTWMSNNIILIKKDEFNLKTYEFGIALKKLDIKLSKNRPSPSQSSKLFKIGTIKRGNDGNKWIVKKFGKSFRWVKYNL